MLIYNYQKEFLGIDETDLETLGYNDLSALREEATDIADLFVKTPGYVHNFKHVHWIDFVACSDPSEAQKVIIHANGRNFRATVSVSNAYLVENPSSKAYLVYLHNMRQLNDNELETLHDDILDRRTTPVTPQPEIETHIQKEVAQPIPSKPSPSPEPQQKTTPKEMPQPKAEFKPEPVVEQAPIIQEPPAQKEVLSTKPVEDDFKIDINLDEMPKEPGKTTIQPQTKKVTKVVTHKEKFDNGYIYDPAVASKELGLPLDLIEEFIQDFIAQANDFKPDLYTSLDDGDIDTVKSLSHKLKGVAANLRIEDAFETLSIINTTSDTEIIKTNLDFLYKIMSKLAGEEVEEVIEDVVEEAIEIQEAPEVIPTDASKEEAYIDIEDDLMLDFKEDIETPDTVESKASDIEAPQDEFNLGFKDEIDFVPETELKTPTINVTSQKAQVSKPEINVEVQYSKTKIANEIGLDQESFNELFQDYLKDSFLILKDIKKFIEDDNLSEIKIEVSKLKGMSDNMRVNDFNEELECLIHTTEHEERITAAQKIEAVLKKLSEQGE